MREQIPALTEGLQLENASGVRALTSAIDTKLLSRFAPDFPLVAAVCGGGSSGKSTLFNSLLQAQLAPTGGKAGLNRRVLFSLPAQRAENADVLAHFARAFGADPLPLSRQDDLLTPGAPLYAAAPGGTADLVLLDTPDFDTGAGGRYTNRELAECALEAADVLIYIFTNSNYNNRDNTDFIARILTGIGQRHCFLVYRVYPSFTEEEVREHAATVAAGIYGADASDYVLGIYRSDEDNRVAAGERFMALRPAFAGMPRFKDALEGLNVLRLRATQHSAILADVLDQTREIAGRARVALDRIGLYKDALLTVQSGSVQMALQHFPLDHVMRRFAQIWSESDPGAVKFMRRAGAIVEFPLKALMGVAGWTRRQLSASAPAVDKRSDFSRTLEEDLVTAVTELHQRVLGATLSASARADDPAARRMQQAVARICAAQPDSAECLPMEARGGGMKLAFTAAVPQVLIPAQDELRERDFSATLEEILEQKDALLAITESMEADLRALADEFRRRMGLWEKIGQTFWAVLNVLPATVAVTYVLSTGDPVGAVGIKVKLAGLFGVKDLYALLAIPATRGLKKADRKQLEAMLGPIVRTWLDHKMKKVDDLFTRKLTGGLLAAAEAAAAEADRRLGSIDAALTDAARLTAARQKGTESC